MTRPLHVALWVLVALIGATAITSLWWPWGRDQSAMAYMGHVIVGGGMPYRDAWDINAPGGYLLHAALEAVVGPARWPLRLLDLALLALTAWCLFLIGRQVHSPPAGVWAAVVFVLLYLSLGHWNTAQRDGWVAMLTVWALAALLSGSLRGAALAGLVIGCAVLLKPTGLAYALPVGVWLVERGRAASPGRRVAAVALFALLVALPVAAALAWLAHGGALRDAYEQVILFNARVYGHSSPGALLRACRTLASVLAHRAGKLALLALAAWGAVRLVRARVPGRWTLTLALPLTSAGVLVLQGKFFPYHWHSLNAAFALLAGVGVAALWRRPVPEGRAAAVGRVALALAGLVAVLGPSYAMGRQVAAWGQHIAVEHDYNGYLGGFDNADYSLRADQQVAAYLAAHSSRDDTILCWGLEPDILLLSGRGSASRLGGSFPFAATELAAPELHARLLQELLAELDRNRPLYFVVVDRDTNPIMPRTSAQVLESMTSLKGYVTAHYTAETVIEDFTLLRRK